VHDRGRKPEEDRRPAATRVPSMGRGGALSDHADDRVQDFLSGDGDARTAMRRRAFLAGGGAALLSTALAACGKESEDEGGGEEGAGNFPATKNYRFVFVNHVTTNPFFVPTQYGAEDASALLGTSFQWTGSKTADVGEMVNAMNTAISGKVDGIAVCIVDPKAFNEPTQTALDAGIPVVSYNADDPDNARLAYIGQDLYLSGQEMGKRIVELVDSGEVALFIATPGSLNIQPRIDGAIDSIKRSGKDIQYKSIATGAELNEELSRIDAYYLGNKNLKGMFAVDAGSTQAVGQVMEKYKLRDQGVKAGGYDTLPKTLELLKADQLDFSIDQQAYMQGFEPVVQLYMTKLSGGLTGTGDVNTGLKFITKDDAGTYLDNPSRFEGSTKDQKVIPSGV
jgi:simple sugar transport system substrate-binding protein